MMMPKQCVDVNGHEVDRFVRLDNKGVIEYISFRSPNRINSFQNELYPPFQSNIAASNYEQWVSGVDKEANMIQLTEDMDANTLHPHTKSAFLAKIKKDHVAPKKKVEAGDSAQDSAKVA
jgi:hypothetical protein